jgi:anthranilate synthase component 2
MRIFILDNYDSFTYNLVHYFEDLNCEVTVVRNDEVDVFSLSAYDAIILSPGPGLPKEAGVLMDVIRIYSQVKPILGVCLGMQAIALHFGDCIENQKNVKHGVQESCDKVVPCALLNDIPSKFLVGLYHSWEVKLSSDSHLIPTSYSENRVLMSLRHRKLPIYGVQFHPESILTPEGKLMLKNFISSI